jgi:hypothetical protein
MDGMEGWCSPEKALAMAELILEVRPKLVVELGVFGGRSLVPQAIALRETGQGVIIGIDPWENEAALEGVNNPADRDWWSTVDLDYIHRHCMEHIWLNELEHYIVIVRARSERCLPALGLDEIDICHIDGNHSELASCRDVADWVPRVRSGGYVWFDDSNWESTQKAVEMMLRYAVPLTEIGNENERCRLFRRT